MKCPNRKSAAQSHRKSRGSKGFTLVETILAIAILAIGVMSLATLIPYATRNDYRSRMDTTATFIATRQLEQMLAQPFTVVSFTSAADGSTATPPSITVSCSNPPPTPPATCSAGAALVSGRINFSQAAGSVPAGYRRVYTIPPGVAGAPKINGGTYDVRWNVAQNANGVRTIIIGARPVGNQPGATSVPINLVVTKMR